LKVGRRRRKGREEKKKKKRLDNEWRRVEEMRVREGRRAEEE